MDQTLLEQIRAALITYYGSKMMIQLTDETRSGQINMAKIDLSIMEAYNAIAGVVSNPVSPFATSLVRRLSGFYLMDGTREEVRKSIEGIMKEAKQASDLDSKKDLTPGIDNENFVSVEQASKFRDNHLWD